eukprot:12716817-Alexandrium_andersonii.AAC.1
MPRKAAETVSCSCLQLSTVVCTPLQGVAPPLGPSHQTPFSAHQRASWGFGGVGGSLPGEERRQLSEAAE